jgi:hypothetical protein
VTLTQNTGVLAEPQHQALRDALTLSSALPWNLMVLMVGQKRLNSFIQLPRVDLGTMTMWGPLMPRYSFRYATKLMVWSVLPRP